MTSSSARGYDDTKELKEMAIGIFDGRFKSVDHAARSVLSDPKQSNVDRLRRKFRQQGWMDKGRDEFLHRAKLAPENDGDPFSLKDYMYVVAVRLRHPISTLRDIFAKEPFWNAPYIPAMFIAFVMGLLPAIQACVKTALGMPLPEDFSLWLVPVFVLLSLLPLGVCLLALEEYQDYPTLRTQP